MSVTKVITICAVAVTLIYGVNSYFDIRQRMLTNIFWNQAPKIAAPRDHPPLRIVIGAHVYWVHFTTKYYLQKNGCLAFSMPEKKEIWLDARENRQAQQDSLLHEIMHSALFEAGGENLILRGQADDKEEGFVNPISPVMVQVLKDNPSLVKWLTSGS